MRPQATETKPDKAARDADIRERLMRGETLRQIAEAAQLSHQRVSHILLTKFGLTARDGGRRQGQIEGANRSKDAEVEQRAANYEAYTRAEYGVSYADWEAYRRQGLIQAYQTLRSRRRNDEGGFKLTFLEWLAVWQESKRLSKRGGRRGEYGLFRKDATKPWELGNLVVRLRGQKAGD